MKTAQDVLLREHMGFLRAEAEAGIFSDMQRAAILDVVATLERRISGVTGWIVTWTSDCGSGVDGPYTDFDWAIARVRENAKLGRIVTIGETR